MKRTYLGPLAVLFVCAGLWPAWSYTDAELGFEMEPPQGWAAQPTSSPRAGLRTKAWVSPDQKGALSVTVLGMPQAAPPRKFIVGDEAASRQLGPNAYQLVSQAAVAGNAIQGWGSVSQFAMGGNTVKRRRAYFASGDKLYLVIGDAAPADYEKLSAAFEAAVVSFGIAGGPKPNSYQSIDGDTYSDPEYSFSVKKPGEEWILYTTKSPSPIARRLLVATAPDGQSCGSVTVCKLPGNLTAQQCVQSDLQALKRIDPGLKVAGTAARQLGGVNGYAFLVEFGAGQKQMRWGVYVMHNGLLYMLICEAVPSTSYERWKEAFGQFAGSLRFE